MQCVARGWRLPPVPSSRCTAAAAAAAAAAFAAVVATVVALAFTDTVARAGGGRLNRRGGPL